MTRGQPTRQRGQGKAGQTPGASYAPAQHEPAATPATPVSPASPVQPPTAVERPATLPDSSRATLRTMTGVDPASVRIYRGPLAERVTAAQNADALTDGGAIALGAGHATDTPETLGLLAHELTHVAQRRTPRFVPPIASSATATVSASDVASGRRVAGGVGRGARHQHYRTRSAVSHRGAAARSGTVSARRTTHA